MRVVVAFVGVIVVLVRLRLPGLRLRLTGPRLAFKCLIFGQLPPRELAPRGLGLGWLPRRIFRLAFLCCFFQVISYPLPLEEDTAKSRFLLHIPQTISLRDVAIGVKWGKGLTSENSEDRRRRAFVWFDGVSKYLSF